MAVSNFEMEVGWCNVKSAVTVSSGTSGCCLSCCVSCERRVNLIDGFNDLRHILVMNLVISHRCHLGKDVIPYPHEKNTLYEGMS